MRRSLVSVACLTVAVSACELDEITVVKVEDVVLAEVYVSLAGDSADNEILALLHRTVAGRDLEQIDSATADLVAARITVRRPVDGLLIRLLNESAEACIDEERDDVPLACFRADPAQAARLRPGDVLDLDVELAEGGRLESRSKVPGSFDLAGIPDRCFLPPDTLMPLRWSRSEGAGAYVNETAISGLPEALRSEGIDVEEDPLYLLGLSISDSDTTIAFPSEFGVFNRLDLDQDLAVRLQRGLPAGSTAEITITAVDGNYVNWARGGNFNPSGQVRVSSLRGDGSGVFGSTVSRRIFVTTRDDGGDVLGPCPIA